MLLQWHKALSPLEYGVIPWMWHVLVQHRCQYWACCYCTQIADVETAHSPQALRLRRPSLKSSHGCGNCELRHGQMRANAGHAAAKVLSLSVMHAVVEEAVAQTDATEGELQSAMSGDSQQRGSTPEGLYDAEDGADSVLAKSGRKTRSQAGQRLPAGQHVKSPSP